MKVWNRQGTVPMIIRTVTTTTTRRTTSTTATRKRMDFVTTLCLMVLVLLSSTCGMVEMVHGFSFSPLPKTATTITRQQQPPLQRLLLATSSSSSSSSSSSPSTSTATTSTTTTTTTNITIPFPSYFELMDLRVGECVISDPFIVSGIKRQTSNNNNDDNNQHKFCVKLYPRGGGVGSSSSSNSLSGKGGKQQQQQDKMQKSGFGMSYKVLPLFDSNNNMNNLQNQKVGMYLQYLGKVNSNNNDYDNNVNSDEIDTDDNIMNYSIDVTFALRLKGRQEGQSNRRRRFDVEWRAGMRFVPTIERSNLANGYANDFGASLMQTIVLSDFLGITDKSWEDDRPVMAEIEVTIHNESNEDKEDNNNDTNKSTSISISPWERWTRDIRLPLDDNEHNDDVNVDDISNKNKNRNAITYHDTERVRVGKIIVPVLDGLGQRQRMFELGVYPGVEYRILRILDNKTEPETNLETEKERFTSCPDATYELKPIYPLVQQLERQWPVSVNEREIPKLFTPGMYNGISALGSLFTAITGLTVAYILSQAISFFVIPSRSMDPTLQVGDVLLVEKVTPRIFGTNHRQQIGDVVMFHPPDALRDIVSSNGGKLSDRDLFVKRIAAIPGDVVSVVDKSGTTVLVNGRPSPVRRDLCQAEPLRLIERYIQPSTTSSSSKSTTTEEKNSNGKTYHLNNDEYFVLGDCSSVSIDSRVWGPLSSEQIIGRPVVRIWPIDDRIGSLPDPPRQVVQAETGTTTSGTRTTTLSPPPPLLPTNQWDD